MGCVQVSPEAQLIAVSEARGWYGFSHEKGPDGQEVLLGLGETFEPRRKEPVPDYLHDLNAIHEAEKLLSEQYDTYRAHLTEICLRDWAEGRHYTQHGESATAAQRVHAFLLTLGMWKDG
jgi:hypothetical protein